MTDFSKALVRCSAIGCIMTEPRGCITEKQLKLQQLQDKPKLTEKQLEELAALVLRRKESESEPLSEAAQTYLIELYTYMVHGRRFKDKAQFIKQIQKGNLVEEDSLDLISRLDKQFYFKNDERLNNEFFTGEPDVYLGKSIREAKWIEDVKSSWDLETFMPRWLQTELDPIYWWQLQGYFDLTGATEGAVSFCLVNTPEPILNDEKRRLLYTLGAATDENPEYKRLAAELEFNSKFDDIPLNEKRIRFLVKRDDEAIAKAKKRVERCRRWLAEYHDARLSLLNTKQLETV
jgi:hypothetical protein